MVNTQSISEKNGLSHLTTKDLAVYSIGISTGGKAEINMAKNMKTRKIIATTIDPQGAKDAKTRIERLELDKQIEVKLEDVSKPLPYKDGSFDYIYARLVLHYLTKQSLPQCLQELKRVLKKRGKLYVVVRSTECADAKKEGAPYDEESGLTTYQMQKETGEIYTQKRFFHTEESIRNYLLEARFRVHHVKSYKERLFIDFMRHKPSNNSDYLIELLATK